MDRLTRLIRSAAALLAAALLLYMTACGGTDDKTDSTTQPSDDASTTASAGPRTPGAPIELASNDSVVDAVGEDPGDLLTGSTSLAFGDFNDDGKADILIGASQADGPDNGRTDGGEAYVLFGPLDGTMELGQGKADLTIFGASAGDNLGFAVLAADVNDDGVDDAIVAAPGVTAGFDPRSDQGRVYVFFGSDDFDGRGDIDLTQDAFDFTVTGAEGFSRLGYAIASGDVDGDGVQDLVIGAPFAGRKPDTPPGSERTALGEVYVILGGQDLSGERNIAALDQDSLISGAFAFAEFGAAVASADINDDGRDDIIVGAHRTNLENPPRASSGAAYVFFGRSKLPERISAQDGDQDVTILGVGPSAFGFPIAAGDFNGDGTGDFAVGAQLETSENVQNRGSVRVFFGDDNFPDEIDLAEDSADVTLTGALESEFLPSALTSSGAGEGEPDDLIIGSMLANADDSRFGSGIAYVVTLSGDAQDTIDLTTESTLVSAEAAGDRLGNSLAANSDESGEGSYFAILAPNADRDGREDAGVVYIVRVK